MRITTMLKAFATAAVLALVATATGCGTDSSPGTGTGATALDGFVSLATRGTHLDLDPLVSPRDAVDRSTVTVLGTLVDITDGISLQFPQPELTERSAGSHATFVIQIDTVLSGDRGLVREGRAFVSVRKNTGASIAELAAANPRPRIVLVLVDLADWAPDPDVVVRRPATIPTAAPLFAAYGDGLWMQAAGEQQMRGLHADLEDLAPGWESVRTVDAYAAAIRTAA